MKRALLFVLLAAATAVATAQTSTPAPTPAPAPTTYLASGKTGFGIDGVTSPNFIFRYHFDRSISMEVAVQPDPCTTPVNLAVGEVRIFSGPTAVRCITLAPTTQATDFVFVTAIGVVCSADRIVSRHSGSSRRRTMSATVPRRAPSVSVRLDTSSVGMRR